MEFDSWIMVGFLCWVFSLCGFLFVGGVDDGSSVAVVLLVVWGSPSSFLGELLKGWLRRNGLLVHRLKNQFQIGQEKLR